MSRAEMNVQQPRSRSRIRLHLASARMVLLTAAIGLLAGVSPEWIASNENSNSTTLFVNSSLPVTSARSRDVIDYNPKTDDAIALQKKTADVRWRDGNSNDIKNAMHDNCSRNETINSHQKENPNNVTYNSVHSSSGSDSVTGNAFKKNSPSIYEKNKLATITATISSLSCKNNTSLPSRQLSSTSSNANTIFDIKTKITDYRDVTATPQPLTNFNNNTHNLTSSHDVMRNQNVTINYNKGATSSDVPPSNGAASIADVTAPIQTTQPDVTGFQSHRSDANPRTIRVILSTSPVNDGSYAFRESPGGRKQSAALSSGSVSGTKSMLLALYDRGGQREEGSIRDRRMDPSETGKIGGRNSKQGAEMGDRADREDPLNANYEPETRTAGSDGGHCETGYEAVTVGREQKSNEKLTELDVDVLSTSPLVNLFHVDNIRKPEKSRTETATTYKPEHELAADYTYIQHSSRDNVSSETHVIRTAYASAIMLKSAPYSPSPSQSTYSRRIVFSPETLKVSSPQPVTLSAGMLLEETGISNFASSTPKAKNDQTNLMDLAMKYESLLKRKRHEMYPTDTDETEQENGDGNRSLQLSKPITSTSSVITSEDGIVKSAESSSCNAVLRLADNPVLLRFPGKTVRVKRGTRRRKDGKKTNSRKSAVGERAGFGGGRWN